MRPDAELAVCFHRGQSEKFGQRLISNIIKWVSGGPYAHVELYVNGPCFSAHGYENRVGFTQIYFSHPKWWDVYSVDLINNTDIEYFKFTAGMQARMKKIDGKKYDYWGAIFSPQSDINIEVKSRWFCSEAVGYVLGLRNYRLTPVKLLPALKEKFILNKIGFVE